MVFVDRVDAGRRLGDAVVGYAPARPVVVGLPRGGVVVACEVARRLHAVLDVVVVRKVGAPFQPELAVGATAEGNVEVFNVNLGLLAESDKARVSAAVAAARAELERRCHLFRGDSPPVPLAGRTVVVVDDGLATGATARAAIKSVRQRGAGCVVLAVPVGAASTVETLRPLVDTVVCLQTPADLMAIGYWYRDFRQVDDADVVSALRRAREADRTTVEITAGAPTPARRGEHAVKLAGDLVVPPGPAGVVLFAHGSGSSRLSPRNQAVAAALNREGFATLLFDLLSVAEEQDRANVFDIDLLADRLETATRFVLDDPTRAWIPLGYFGASTGAAAALTAAAALGTTVGAVVSRGGRPDLTDPDCLAAVTAPTLLIVGGHDIEVLELNRLAQTHLRCTNQLEVVPGATHLFEEPGTLDRVSELAADWFHTHLHTPAGEHVKSE